MIYRMFENLSVDEFKAQFKEANTPHLLLDVRTGEEFEEGRIPGAINIPLDDLDNQISHITALAGDMPIVLVCRSGMRSMMGAETLRYAGVKHTLYNLEGGTLAWANKRLPLDSGQVE
jgi:rhodanese-related sulfurtransferase